MPESRRRPVLSVIGSGGALTGELESLSVEVGRLAIEAGFRVVTGGLGGVMEAVSRGAREAPSWREGDIVGILPGYDRNTANASVDIVIPSGMQMARNILVVSMADVVLAVGGGSGTLSELALAWQLGKPILMLEPAGGWASRFGGERLDHRHDLPIQLAHSPLEAIARAKGLLEVSRHEPGDIGSGWRRPPE